MWTSREYIQTRNEKYFLDRDYNDLIKKDANQELIQSLVDLIKSGWKTLDAEEKDVIWQKTRTMLKAVIYFTKWERASSKQ
jgi:Mg2+/Co2+ transporter CorC